MLPPGIERHLNTVALAVRRATIPGRAAPLRRLRTRVFIPSQLESALDIDESTV
jgi:hypothetical protein